MHLNMPESLVHKTLDIVLHKVATRLIVRQNVLEVTIALTTIKIEIATLEIYRSDKFYFAIYAHSVGFKLSTVKSTTIVRLRLATKIVSDNRTIASIFHYQENSRLFPANFTH